MSEKRIYTAITKNSIDGKSVHIVSTKVLRETELNFFTDHHEATHYKAITPKSKAALSEKEAIEQYIRDRQREIDTLKYNMNTCTRLLQEAMEIMSELNA